MNKRKRPDYLAMGVSPAAIKRAADSNKPPIGACGCGQRGELQNGGNYWCARCLSLRKTKYDAPDYFGRCGSNIHRITGRPVDMHILAEDRFVYHVCPR